MGTKRRIWVSLCACAALVGLLAAPSVVSAHDGVVHGPVLLSATVPQPVGVPLPVPDALQTRFVSAGPLAMLSAMLGVQPADVAGQTEPGRRLMSGQDVRLQLFGGNVIEVDAMEGAMTMSENPNGISQPFFEYQGRAVEDGIVTASVVFSWTSWDGSDWQMQGSVFDAPGSIRLTAVAGHVYGLFRGAETTGASEGVGGAHPAEGPPADVRSGDVDRHGVGEPEVRMNHGVHGTQTRVDVAVAYSNGYFDRSGTSADGWAITSDMRHEVALLNLSLGNSLINARVSLILVVHVNYNQAAGGNLANDLNNLRQGHGGLNWLEHVRTNRQVDLVQLVVPDGSHCGRGDVPLNTSSPGYAPAPWNVVAYSCVGPHAGPNELSSAHEFGHNLGGNHQIQEAGDTPYVYSHGNAVSNVGTTVMAYSSSNDGQVAYCTNCPTKPQFSHPYVSFIGTSHPSGSPLQDNARSIAQQGPHVQAYRTPGTAPDAFWEGPINNGLGALMTSSPDAAAVRGHAPYAIVTKGQLDNVYFARWHGTGWAGYKNIGKPILGMKGEPTIVARTTGSYDVFARGLDDKLWQTYSTDSGGTWATWFQPLGLDGTLASGPDATSPIDGRLDLVIRGTDGLVYWRTWEPTSGWNGHPWQSVGGLGAVDGDPTITSMHGGRLDVFAKGIDDKLYQTFNTTNINSSAAFTGWFRPPGTESGALGAPNGSGVVDATSWGAGHNEVVIKGIDGYLYATREQGGTWSSWTRLGSTSGGPNLQTQTSFGPGVISRGLNNVHVLFAASNAQNDTWQVYWRT